MTRKTITYIVSTMIFCMLLLTGCSTSQIESKIKTIVYDMFSAPNAYMKENHELLRGYPLGIGVPEPTQEELDSLNAQRETTIEEFQSQYDNVYKYCTENGIKNFFSAVTDMQFTSADFSIPVEVRSVDVELISKKNSRYRFTAQLVINQNREIEVTGKMQTDKGKIASIDAREAIGAAVQVLHDEINSQYSTIID